MFLMARFSFYEPKINAWSSIILWTYMNLRLIQDQTYTRGIWKVMHIHLYKFTQYSEKKDEGINVKRQDMGLLGVPYFNVCIGAITS